MAIPAGPKARLVP
jgi:hypothetical protein